jgi:light-regulated signal transduction histidine kinase (bacteriophytochrome)
MLQTYLNPTILIVDDSKTDRDTYRRYLEPLNNCGYRILACESAEDALELCDRDLPQLILLDYFLLDMDGLEFLRQLADRVETLPSIIMLTGQGSEMVAVEAMKLGVKDYRIKRHITAQDLVNAITIALTQQQLQAQIDRQDQQQNLLGSIMLKIGNLTDLSAVLQAAVDGVRQLLDCDRAIVYKLRPDLSGVIVSESVLPQWQPILDLQFNRSRFNKENPSSVNKYFDGHKLIVSDIESDIETVDLESYDLEMLHQFQVKALLAVPILLHDASPVGSPKVWGLIIVHNCKAARIWQPEELGLIDQLSIQMAIAIQQAELVLDLKLSLEKQQAIENQLRDQVIQTEQTNSRLSLATNSLEKRNQELDDFACIASHDLQAPLRGISNLTDWLAEDLKDLLPLENQQQLDLIKSQVLQMSALLKGLLRFARVGREHIDVDMVDLGQLLAEVVEAIAPPPNFQVYFPTDVPTLTTQSLLLRQVFANLIDNAIKYHDRPDGKIEILATKRENLWEFTVVDDGPGIAPEHQKKIFSIFQTLTGQAGKGQTVKGSGVGLAIVQKIVESQGGSIWVESSLGKGSAFSFTWY